MFLRQNTLATISTVNKGTLQPESALVAFAELEDLSLLFTTLRGSRKYLNLMDNNKVAMVVGWNSVRAHWSTLQYEGPASPVPQEEDSRYKEIFSKKKETPCSKEFLLKPEMQLFRVTPTWIGYSDFTGHRPRVIELCNFNKT